MNHGGGAAQGAQGCARVDLPRCLAASKAGRGRSHDLMRRDVLGCGAKVITTEGRPIVGAGRLFWPGAEAACEGRTAFHDLALRTVVGQQRQHWAEAEVKMSISPYHPL